MSEGCVLEVDGNGYESITETVVFAAAAIRDEELDRIEPLYDAIDPDALESLAASGDGVRITFEYAGLTMTVLETGTVRIDEPISTESDDA